MIDLSAEILLLLAITGLVAGTIDAIAGGGGLLTMPMLLTTGLPPHLVLGTNKMQSTAGTAMATWHYARAGLIDWRAMRPAVIATFLGAAIGTLLVQQIAADFLAPLVPFLLIAMAVYFLWSPRLSDRDSHARISMIGFVCGIAPVIGFYDGFFGPGTGSFFTLALIALLGMNVTRATANTKLLNLTSNAASLAMFIAAGQVVWAVAAVMIPGQIIGGLLGSRLALQHGGRLIKPVLVLVSLGLSLKLLWPQILTTLAYL